jgi:uncharacterized protein (TIGR03435 family)
MPRLIEILTDEVGRTVVDKTGFTGTFNFQLDFAPVQVLAGGPGDAGDANLPAASIFAALQQQLGLRLQSTRGPVEILIIEHVERPSEN